MYFNKFNRCLRWQQLLAYKHRSQIEHIVITNVRYVRFVFLDLLKEKGGKKGIQRVNSCLQAMRKDLESDHGDPITILNAYREWLELKRGQFNHKNESTKKWCRKRGLEEQRFYEITKLRRQFDDLLKDSSLLSVDENDEEMDASERIIRKGELRQLKRMRYEHKSEATKRRKLKMNQYTIENEDEDDGSVDIRDIDFRLSNDPSKIDVSNFFIL